MMARKRKNLDRVAAQPQGGSPVSSARLGWFGPFLWGSLLTGLIVFVMTTAFQARQSGGQSTALRHASNQTQATNGSSRSVAELLAPSDEELEKTDIVELNLAVAREIPGLENLDIGKYQRIVNEWAAQIARDLPHNERVFRQTPEKWDHSIHLFRLGQVAGFLDQQCGIAYNEEQKELQLKNVREFRYTNPGDLFLRGLIDTKRGTCGNMPTFHVAIGRRLGWPVSLASVRSHSVCRFDNGKIVHNLEATDTGRGGFAVASDKEYAEKFGISKLAIERGSELRSMTAREMLGYFIALRARHYADIGELGQADVDYALARSIIPNHRRTYMGAVQAAVGKGSWLFDQREMGHPTTLARAIDAEFGNFSPGPAPLSPATHPAMDDPLYYARKLQREQEIAAQRNQSVDPYPTMPPGFNEFGIPHSVGYPPANHFGPAEPTSPPY